MQIIASDETVRSDTIQDLKDFNSQSLTTQARKREQLVSMMPALKRLLIIWMMILLNYLRKTKL